jgi:hypothetical protein
MVETTINNDLIERLLATEDRVIEHLDRLVLRPEASPNT